MIASLRFATVFNRLRVRLLLLFKLTVVSRVIGGGLIVGALFSYRVARVTLIIAVTSGLVLIILAVTIVTALSRGIGSLLYISRLVAIRVL